MLSSIIMFKHFSHSRLTYKIDFEAFVLKAVLHRSAGKNGFDSAEGAEGTFRARWKQLAKNDYKSRRITIIGLPALHVLLIPVCWVESFPTMY